MSKDINVKVWHAGCQHQMVRGYIWDKISVGDEGQLESSLERTYSHHGPTTEFGPLEGKRGAGM